MKGSAKEAPRVLFFSGGTALGPVAASLAHHTTRSVHLVTPFDSGGSSAELRRVFNMPAVGDLRARILSLADPDREGNQALVALLGRRLAPEAGPGELRSELISLAKGTHLLEQGLAVAARCVVMRLLRSFLAVLPDHMDLRGASVGNLVLTAAYLEAGRRLAPAAARLSALVRARGLVRPVVDADAHLGARLADGRVILGQHRFTGKDVPCITSPIEDIRLFASCNLFQSAEGAWGSGFGDECEAVQPAATSWVLRLIRSADLICFPVGSFYSSVLANLLPHGVSAAVLAASCPKVFIPNPVPDPELLGHTVQDQVERLVRQLHSGTLSQAATSHRTASVERSERVQSAAGPGSSVESDRAGKGLDVVLADDEAARYPGGLPESWLRGQGIRLVRKALVTPGSAPLFDPDRVSQALLELC